MLPWRSVVRRGQITDKTLQGCRLARPWLSEEAQRSRRRERNCFHNVACRDSKKISGKHALIVKHDLSGNWHCETLYLQRKSRHHGASMAGGSIQDAKPRAIVAGDLPTRRRPGGSRLRPHI